MKHLLKKYNHAIAILYLPFYVLSFMGLERKNTEDYYVVESELDQLIPFCEWFVIPYFLWFAYIAVTFAYFFFADKQDFIRLCIFLFTGMTICLAIYYIWPNGQNLRPDLTTLGRDNLFIRILAGLYSTDTHTNVCPSIHTFNSVGACIAIYKANSLKSKKAIRIGALVLTVSICLSTVFLKQHSILDVFWALVLAVPMYLLAYLPKLDSAKQTGQKASAN
jgi:membrane-associated phospholipid phosphatase